MRNDHEFTSVGKHLQARLKQKKRTKMSVASYMLHHLRHYARYPDEMRVKFSRGVLKIILVDQEDKTLWFHHREQYRTTLNEHLQAMNYEVQIQKIIIK